MIWGVNVEKIEEKQKDREKKSYNQSDKATREVHFLFPWGWWRVTTKIVGAVH